ncbi:tetratricopeptide repeat protein [Nonomuraea jabiensis]|uniref:tetratricopeptide repeat protein n=1 Tax=Nonomuraea jabiensis TaxID=882448 RepID=UPI003D705F1E
MERVLGAEHRSTLSTRHNLAGWTGQAGDAVGARDQLAALPPIRERGLGPEHPDTLKVRHNLAYEPGRRGTSSGCSAPIITAPLARQANPARP